MGRWPEKEEERMFRVFRDRIVAGYAALGVGLVGFIGVWAVVSR